MKTRETLEFFYLKFFYSPRNALVPRLETESLVRESLAILKSQKFDIIIDVGTGTGIIPISIEKSIVFSGQTYGLDKSSNALKLANLNKGFHSSKVEFLKSDLLSVFIEKTGGDFYKKNILITANLPYIKDGDWVNMSEDTVLEPKMALFGGSKTGFEMYEKFFRQVVKFKDLHSIGSVTVVCEFGFDQSEIAEKFFINNGFKFSLFPDLRGINRFVRVDI